MVEVFNYLVFGEINFVVLVFFYVIYWGDIFWLGGQGGVRVVFFEKSDFEVDLSVSGVFFVESKVGSVCEGMFEFDFMFEIGL